MKNQKNRVRKNRSVNKRRWGVLAILICDEIEVSKKKKRITKMKEESGFNKRNNETRRYNSYKYSYLTI